MNKPSRMEDSGSHPPSALCPPSSVSRGRASTKHDAPSTKLNQLFESIRALLEPRFPNLKDFKPVYRDFRAGDVRHSLADISKAQKLLDYAPTHRIGQGLQVPKKWYVQNLAYLPKVHG
jgi:hypothetical protein